MLGAVLGGCSRGDNPVPEPIVSNIVTYESTTADGSVSTFSFRAVDDSPLITISANWKAPSDLAVGSRLLAYYVTDNPSESGPVELKSLVRIPGGALRDSTDIAAPSGEPLGMQAMWRSGTWLNLNASIYFNGEAREISLYVDPATADRAEVEAYMVVKARADSPVTETVVPRLLVASWDIAPLWNRPTLARLKVNYIGLNTRPASMTFEKIATTN